MLVGDPHRAARYVGVILAGVPIWFFIGILVLLAHEFAAALGVDGPISGADAVFWGYFGLGVGDLAAGLWSQWLGSRRRALLTFLALSAGVLVVYLNARGVSVPTFKGILFLVGFANGYWAVFATTAAEQFGTNLRATVATTAPNFVRGSLVPVIWAWRTLQSTGGLSPLSAAAVVGTACLVLATVAVLSLRETYALDLDYLEGAEPKTSGAGFPSL